LNVYLFSGEILEFRAIVVHHVKTLWRAVNAVLHRNREFPPVRRPCWVIGFQLRIGEAVLSGAIRD